MFGTNIWATMESDGYQFCNEYTKNKCNYSLSKLNGQKRLLVESNQKLIKEHNALDNIDIKICLVLSEALNINNYKLSTALLALQSIALQDTLASHQGDDALEAIERYNYFEDLQNELVSYDLCNLETKTLSEKEHRLDIEFNFDLLNKDKKIVCSVFCTGITCDTFLLKLKNILLDLLA